MNLRRAMACIAFASLATGCAFFDEPISEPVSGNQELIPSRTPAEVTPPPTPQPAAQPAADNVESPSPTSTAPPAAAPVSASYLVVAPIYSFPRDAQNIAVVHLTERNTNRELALCKALMQNMPTVDVQELPANPLTVVFWPVPNDNAGANCLEMISDFEAIDITPEAEKRIESSAAGPYLLTRNLPSGNRMVFDTSFKSNAAMSATVNQWVTLLGSSPENWPEYRRAR